MRYIRLKGREILRVRNSKSGDKMKKVNSREEEEEEEEEEKKRFGELGLDDRLVDGIMKEGMERPTHTQNAAIPLIVKGEDVVVLASTGSGKTLAYLLPLFHTLLSSPRPPLLSSPIAFLLLPTRDLCRQVYSKVLWLIDLCGARFKAAKFSSNMTESEMRAVAAKMPSIVVCTPACIPKCFSLGVFSKKSIADTLSVLVLDEADLMVSYGCIDDLKVTAEYLPVGCQRILMSATTSGDMETLKSMILRNPVVLTLAEETKNKNGEIILNNTQHFYVSCDGRDKLLHILALLKFGLVQKKVVIFCNTIDTSFRLKLFLDKFGIKSSVLNSELPANSRLHISQEFNAGMFDYLITTDGQSRQGGDSNDGDSAKKEKSNKNSGFVPPSVKGVDFRHVFTVISFDMAQDTEAYLLRFRQGGTSYISFVSEREKKIFEEVKKNIAGMEGGENASFIPFPLLTKNAVECLRYRTEDVARSVTKICIREARANDLRKSILSSVKLKDHFSANPQDLELLKRGKVKKNRGPAIRLCHFPDYLIDRPTHQASKIVQLAGAAIGQTLPTGPKFRKKSRKREKRKSWGEGEREKKKKLCEG